MTRPNLRRMRSAESWIGVSGFLISWAMRRATSAQAAVRCAETRSVMSSSVTTRPAPLPSPSRTARTLTMRSCPARVIAICPELWRWRPFKASVTKAAISGATWPIGWPSRRPPVPSRLSAERLAMVMWPVAVEAEHARRDAGEHGLGEAAAAVDDLARRYQTVALAAQLRGHLVEGLAEMGEVTLGTADRHLNVEVPARDLVGGVDHPPDRRDQRVGEAEPEPDRREQQDDGDQPVHRGEGNLDALPARIDREILRRRRACEGRELDRQRIDLPGDVQEGVVIGGQLDQCAEDAPARGQHADRIGRGLRILEGGGVRPWARCAARRYWRAPAPCRAAA